MDNFKNLIYKNYATNHTLALYGQESLLSFKRNFPVWNFYFSKLLPYNKESKILDIGCGKGSFVYFLQNQGYNNAIGIDISEEQIKIGKDLGIKNIDCADLRTFLSENINKFDCIVARDVMEHFTRQEIFEILQLIKKSLKDNGSFIMQSPNGEGLFFSHIYYGDFTHETVFTRSSLNQIFNTLNFSQIEFKSTSPVPKGLLSVIRYVIWGIIVVVLRGLKMIQTGSASGIFTQNIIAKAISEDSKNNKEQSI